MHHLHFSLILIPFIIVNYWLLLSVDLLVFCSPVSSFIRYWGYLCSAVVLTPLPSLLSGIWSVPSQHWEGVEWIRVGLD